MLPGWTAEPGNTKLTMLIGPPMLGAFTGSEANAVLVDTANPWALAGRGVPNFIPFKVIVAATPVPVYDGLVTRDSDWAPKDDNVNWELLNVGDWLLSKYPLG